MLTTISSCTIDKKIPVEKQGYLRWVGDLVANPKIDDKNFKLCYGEERVYQYFNTSNGFQYKGEKKELVRQFREQYQAIKAEDQNGMIRIRFIVNCEGKAGRFRLIEADTNYQAKKFDARIVEQLLTITKKLDGWVPQRYEGTPIDYYLYLTFIIEEGRIKEILP